MRKINAKLFLLLLVGSIVCTGAVFGVHHFQYGRIADALLWQARRAEEQGQVKRQAKYLQRYLEFNPKNLEEKAHLAKLWASDTFAGSTRERLKAVNLLDQVLTRGDDNPELRRLLVKMALEVQQFKMAHNHLEKLLSSEFLKSPLTAPVAAGQELGPQRGESEGYAGQLLEAENQPEKALICYRLAVKHAPAIQSNYVSLALLLRKQKDLTPDATKERQDEADKVIDALVKNNRLSHEVYLSRWRYRRDFGLLELKKEAANGKVNLKVAADDVAEALQRAPESVDVLLAAADLERLEGQSVLASPLPAAEKEKQRSGHRDKALAYLNRGLKLHARGGRPSSVDMTQFRLLWHKANLLMDDIEQLDGARNDAAPAKAERLASIADVTEVIEQIRKTRGSPAATDYLKGRLLLQDRRWAEAVTLFEQVRPTLGSQADLAGQINRYLGQCYEQLVEPGQQYNAYERLLQSEPNSVTAMLGMAQAEWTMGHLEQAAEKFQRLAIAKQMPDKVWLDYSRLEIQRQAQREQPDWNRVEQLLTIAEKANPKATDVPLARAQLCMVARPPNADKARKVLQDAQARDDWKDSVDLWTARIYLELRDKKSDSAQEILSAAKRKLGDRVVLLRLAEARLLAEANGKAAETAINGLANDAAQFKIEEDQARLLSGLADVQLNLDNVKAARALWQRMAKLPSHQTDLSLQLLLFDMAVKAEDEDGMGRTLADIRGVEGNQGPFHRYGEALRLIWRAKKLPNETEDQQTERRKPLDEARRHLDRVESIRPNWPPLFLARAQLDRMTGQNDQAILNLQKAVTFGENSPAVIRDLVELLANAGHFNEADRALKRLRDPLLVNSELGRLAAVVAVNRKEISRANQLMEWNRTPDGTKDYRQLLWEGRMLAETNNAKMAEPKLRAALKMADKEPEPYVALVQFLARQKRETEAAALLEEARKHLPADRVELTLAQCHEVLGQKKSAQARYEVALNGHRKDAVTVRRVAAFYWNAGQLEKAEPLLRDIIEKRVQKPSADDVSWARWHLALVLASGTDYGRFREAIRLVGLKLDDKGQLIRDRERADSTDTKRFQARVLAAQAGHRQFRKRALELLEGLEHTDALRPDDRFILAMLYESESAWSKAKPILLQLADARDPAPRHLAYYVQALIEHKELDEADKMADRLEELEERRGPDQNAFASVELRARLLEVQGKGDAALKRLEQLVRRPKAKPEEILLLLNSMRRQKKFAQALERCTKTWAEKKCSPEVIGGASVAVLRSMQSNGTPATREQVVFIEDHLKKSIEANPKSVVLLLHLAELYDQGGKWEEAEQMYRQVLHPENEPKNIVALNNLSWLLAQRSSDPRQVQEALAKIDSAVNGIGRRADLIDTRGLVYLKLNQDDAALADFREAAADMPTPAHLFHLARAHYKGRDKISASKVLKEARAQGLKASSLHPVEQAEYQRLLEELKIR